eukprot:595634-Amphidinium_carterae.1
MASNPTGLDQLVTALEGVGIDTADMSLAQARQLVSRAAPTGQLPLPASSSQVPPTTIQSRPTDMDEVPLTGLLANDEEKSASVAAILQEAAPLPAPQPIRIVTETATTAPTQS